jgi:hypothetical protein
MSPGEMARASLAQRGIGMYMRVRRIRNDVAKFDEGVAAARDAHAATKQLPGWQSGVIAVDRITGEGFAVTTWDTEDHARFTAAVIPPERGQAAGVQLDPPQIFEVIAN